MPADTLTIAVAGLPVAFRIPDRRMLARLRVRYAGYVCRTAPRITIDCRLMTGLGRGSELVRLTPMPVGGWKALRRDFECCWRGRSGTLRLRRSSYAFDACLRVLLSACLPGRGILLVHGSAVATRDGRAVVFVGPSGSGKTTAARLCRCRHVLNDEICALRVDRRSRVLAAGTPFWGEMGTGPAHPRWLPVSRILLLHKAPTTRITSAQPVRCLASLLRCVCMYGREPKAASAVLAVACAVTNTGLVHRLHFERKPFDPVALAEASIRPKCRRSSCSRACRQRSVSEELA